MDDVDRILARLAKSQGGAFTVDQALRAGVTHGQLRARRRRGSIHRRHPRTYFLGYLPGTPHAERWAAVLAGGPDAMIDGIAAAQDWGFVRGDAAHPEIRVVVRQRTLAGVTCRRSTTIHDEDRASCRGRPTASPERTLVTLADRYDVAHLCRCLREATVLRLIDADRLRRTIERNRNTRGGRRMRIALARFLDGDGGADNRHEARFVRLLHAAGERTAIANFELRIEGAIIRPDIWLPDDEIAIELDEWSHDIPQIGREDRLKEALMRSASIPFMRLDQSRPKEELGRLLGWIDEVRRKREGDADAAGQSHELVGNAMR